MLRKFAMVTTLATAVLSSISGNTVKAEILVPLQQYLNTTNRNYEANQYKTSYTIYVPQLELNGTTITMNPKAVGEPVKLPITKRNGMEYVDLEGTTPLIGVTYTKNDGQLQVSPAPETMQVLQNKPVQGPLSWAFDPWPNQGAPYAEKLNASGDNIISPSWFKLHSLGLESSPNIDIDYVKVYKTNGYHVWPLITNRFDPGFTSGILADEALWKKYAQNLIHYAYIYGFSGYNFDFENVDYADRDRLTKFVAYLADELHKYNIQSSVDVTGYSNSPNWSLVYDRKSFADSVDYVVLMAYDETWAKSTIAGPVASYPWVREHTEKMTHEVPSHKLVLGIPFYTRIWHEVNGSTRGETLAIKNEPTYFSNYASNIIWNDTLKSYYAAIPTASGTDKIWFEEHKSLDYKLNLVKEFKLAGFAAWRKGFEDDTTLAMIKETDLGKGVPTAKPVVEEPKPVVEQPLTKAERKALEKAAKEKTKVEAKAAKEKAKAEAKAAKEQQKAAEKAAKEMAKAEEKAKKEAKTNASREEATTISSVQVVKK